MRVTIIPIDGFVSVNGEGFGGLDLSFIKSNVHAVQWYGSSGEVELKDTKGSIVENLKITSFTPYEKAVEIWQNAKNQVAT